MCRRLIFGQALLTGLMLAPCLVAQEQDKAAKAVIDKALKAGGGGDKINKYPASQFKAKGKVSIANMEVAIVGDFAFQQPDKVRQSLELDIMNQKITNTQVFDGKKGWLQVQNETKELDDDKLLEEFKETMHAQRVATLYRLEKGFSFALVGDAKIKGKEAVGVRVSHKGRRDINLYFAKDTGLLLKTEYRATDPINMKEVTREEYYSAFKAVAGIQTPHKVVIHHDGARFLELEVTEVQYLERHADGAFGKP